MDKKDRQHSIRLSSELTDELLKLAKADDRSFNYMVEQAIRFFVEAQRKKAKR
jgi:predicted transcriptional regulator